MDILSDVKIAGNLKTLGDIVVGDSGKGSIMVERISCSGVPVTVNGFTNFCNGATFYHGNNGITFAGVSSFCSGVSFYAGTGFHGVSHFYHEARFYTDIELYCSVIFTINCSSYPFSYHKNVTVEVPQNCSKFSILKSYYVGGKFYPIIQSVSSNKTNIVDYEFSHTDDNSEISITASITPQETAKTFDFQILLPTVGY